MTKSFRCLTDWHFNRLRLGSSVVRALQQRVLDNTVASIGHQIDSFVFRPLYRGRDDLGR